MEARSRVMPQVVRRLIDEHLELQEADKQKVNDRKRRNRDQCLDLQSRASEQHAARDSMEKLLRSRGVDPETLRQQVKADIAWSETCTHQELTRDIHVGDDAVSTRAWPISRPVSASRNIWPAKSSSPSTVRAGEGPGA